MATTSRKQYYCTKDALKDLELFREQNPLFTISLDQIVEKKQRADGKHLPDTSLADLQRRSRCTKKGMHGSVCPGYKRSEPGWPIPWPRYGETILSYYKEQSQVEKGFRFLKDPVFCVDNVFLKNPKRIMALSMIMVLFGRTALPYADGVQHP